MRKRCPLAMAALLLLMTATPVPAQDTTIQGRCIGFDPAKGQVTVIRDARADMHAPEYQLPPVVFEIPKDSAPPRAGKRIKLDIRKNQIIVYDAALKAFKIIDYKLVSQKENLDPADALVAEKNFPAVDATRKTVTIYSKTQKILTEFTPPADILAAPEDTWDRGDEIRITSKEEGKAATLENLSKK